jgi:hypothetical protein
MTPEDAIFTIAEQIVSREVYPEWDLYPEIGEHDWERVCEVVEAMTPPAPSDAKFKEAYALLESRAGGRSDDAD